jgi:hypothetical protein
MVVISLMGESPEGLLFLKKKKQKDLYSWRLRRDRGDGLDLGVTET